MSSRRPARQLVVAVLLGVLVGGGLMAVTPAGAEVSNAVATNWKKIWKKHLRPLADKRYYTKAKSDARYQPKGSYETAGSGYTKAESDAKYYNKAESDAKYAPAPAVIRGSWSMMDNAASVGSYMSTDINWGYTFSTPLTTHFIPSGGVLPAGCSGTVAAPVAAPGHLCVFAFGQNGVSNPDIRNVSNLSNTTSPFGANLFSTATATGNVYAYGSWAARGSALAPNAKVATSAKSGSKVPGH